jgi:hypothetical protein
LDFPPYLAALSRFRIIPVQVPIKKTTSHSEKWGFLISGHGHLLLWESELWVQIAHYQKSSFSFKMFGEAIGNTSQKRKS